MSRSDQPATNTDQSAEIDNKFRLNMRRHKITMKIASTIYKSLLRIYMSSIFHFITNIEKTNSTKNTGPIDLKYFIPSLIFYISQSYCTEHHPGKKKISLRNFIFYIIYGVADLIFVIFYDFQSNNFLIETLFRIMRLLVSTKLSADFSLFDYTENIESKKYESRFFEIAERILEYLSFLFSAFLYDLLQNTGLVFWTNLLINITYSIFVLTFLKAFISYNSSNKKQEISNRKIPQNNKISVYKKKVVNHKLLTTYLLSNITEILLYSVIYLNFQHIPFFVYYFSLNIFLRFLLYKIPQNLEKLFFKVQVFLFVLSVSFVLMNGDVPATLLLLVCFVSNVIYQIVDNSVESVDREVCVFYDGLLFLLITFLSFTFLSELDLSGFLFLSPILI